MYAGAACCTSTKVLVVLVQKYKCSKCVGSKRVAFAHSAGALCYTITKVLALQHLDPLQQA
jgi:hypothetical protein